MSRLCPAILTGIIIVLVAQSSQAMRRIDSLPPALRKGLPSQAGVGPMQRAAPLTATQQATIARRVRTAMSGLDRVHVLGSKPAPVPPEALDALAEWRDHAAKDVEMWWDPDTRTPFFIKGTDLALPTPTPLAKRGHDLHTASALSTFARLPSFLALRDPESELRPLSRQTDHLGMTHARFQQTYRGHDVWARDLYCHFTADSRMNLINGRWVPTPTQLDGVDPVIDAGTAIQTVRSLYADRSQIDIGDTTLVVYIDSSQTPHWAWMIRTSLGPTEGYDVFIDAVTGEYLHQVSFVYSDGPVVGSGVDLFGQTRTVNAYQAGSWYYMINTTKLMFNPGTSSLPSDGHGVIQIDDWGSPYLYFVKSLNKDSWSNPAAVSASWHLGYVYDYFLQMHGRNGIDGAGSAILAVVNDPTQGHGTGNNAQYNSSTGAMYFGTGNGVQFSNLAKALDVTAHEMGHGVINATAGLAYEFQPGAINESFADIFGVAGEFHVYGGTANWLIGEDVYTPSAPGDALRDLSDPHNGCFAGQECWQPAVMSEYRILPESCYPDTCDHGGVHINSGIPNRAFYLFATGINNFWRADSIYYRALTKYLFSYSQFIDLRLAVTQAASELYPGNSTIANAISSAFDAVEIYTGPSTPPPTTQPAPTSAQWIIARDDLTGRLARFDTAGSFLGYTSAGIAVKKPSVPDSSDAVYFIDNTLNVRFVHPDGSGETQIGNSGIPFANIAVSPDGSRLVYDIVSDPKLYFFDLKDTTGASDFWWPLYTPTYSVSDTMHDVLGADVLEWDIYGQNVMFDCLNALPRQSDTLLYWDIQTIDVATGRIQRILPSIPVGWTIGNPTFGKIHPDLIAFDYFRGDSTFVYAANLSRNSFGFIAGVGLYLYQGRPSFSPNDGRIVFEFNPGTGSNLWRIGFNPDSLKTIGGFEMLVAGASFPNWRFTGRDTPVDVNEPDENAAIPSTFTLAQNYPNPFNSSTVIAFETRTWRPVELEVFNILGQRVFKEVLQDQPPGRHSITWDGRDQSGRAVPSGLYLYRVTADGTQQTRKMVVLK